MYLDEDGGLVLSPTDLVAFLACQHLTELSLDVACGRLPEPTTDDPEVEVLRRRGMEHERTYLEQLAAEGVGVAVVPPELPFAEQVDRTTVLLRSGVAAVYQGAFLTAGDDGRPSWRGHADFVRRVDGASDLGPFSFEPEDTKLARRVKPGHVLQLCEYAAQLATVQGCPPERAVVVLGGQERVPFRVADFAAYHRAAKRRLEEAVAAGVDAYPWPVAHCPICSWRQACDERRLADDHLTVVAGLTGEQARKLQRAGISTVAGLAATEVTSVPRIGRPTFERLRRQARLQVMARDTPDGPPPYELLDCPGSGTGLGALPPPSPGDLFFDIESDPFAEDGGLEYLLGFAWEEDGELRYRPFWAHDRAEERQAFESAIDFMTARLDAHPDLHVYHFAPYEPAALGRLMGRHATREEEVDRLLRAGTLVDLYQVVRQGVRVGTPSYSLKKLEGLYMPARTEAITDGGSSLVAYERFVETGDVAILEELAQYNAVDCDSTRRLRDWLEERRAEYAEDVGAPPPRLDPRDGTAPENVAEIVSEVALLKAKLAEVHPAVQGDALGRATALLGELLDWHRREDKPEWWRYYDRILRCEEDDLLHDTEAVTGLVYEGTVGEVKRSVLHRYRFDPGQEHKLSPGHPWADPDALRLALLGGPPAKSPGEIYAVDPVHGYVDLKRGRNAEVPHPRSLIPPGPIKADHQREAIWRVARSVIDHGMDGDGPDRAARDILLRRSPRLVGGPTAGELRRPGEDPVTAVVRLATELDGGCLAVQGPPGSGKTRAAARAVVELVHRGRQVGITANSHAVIANLLTAVVELAVVEGVPLRAAQKSDDDREVDHPSVEQLDTNDAMAAALDHVDVLAGTPWLFSHPLLERSLDHLVVDEAGQLSLANVVAVSVAADNLVLVGDPQQLAQPSRGAHPPGADASALAHLLGVHETMPEDLGVFLGTTHRLHPAICAYVSELFYEGRLHAEPGCERQAVGGTGWLSGSGLRWLPVDHAGNRTSSAEEALALTACVDDLNGRPWTDRSGAERPLALDDLLVVAPYNAQVSLLGEALPSGARIGTVDKFQGQEAPVVLVSLASSSAEDVPRGMEFLYSRHRLNVAVSRAQGLTVLVASPRLLAAACRTVDQLRLVNGLCRYVELAGRG